MNILFSLFFYRQGIVGLLNDKGDLFGDFR